jgi:hypothetical protein
MATIHGRRASKLPAKFPLGVPTRVTALVPNGTVTVAWRPVIGIGTDDPRRLAGAVVAPRYRA